MVVTCYAKTSLVRSSDAPILYQLFSYLTKAITGPAKTWNESQTSPKTPRPLESVKTRGFCATGGFGEARASTVFLGQRKPIPRRTRPLPAIVGTLRTRLRRAKRSSGTMNRPPHGVIARKLALGVLWRLARSFQAGLFALFFSCIAGQKAPLA